MGGVSHWNGEGDTLKQQKKQQKKQQNPMASLAKIGALVALLCGVWCVLGGEGRGARGARFTNMSTRRADLHWDDGMWGSVVGTVEPGKSIDINTFNGHKFWFTAHGVGTTLTHAATRSEPKKKAQFTIVGGQREYKLLPAVAVQSGSCNDRFDACTRQASYRACNDNPGWMIVNCPASCKGHIKANGLDACDLQNPREW